jgi:hypothetical protein
LSATTAGRRPLAAMLILGPATARMRPLLPR